MDPSLPSIQGPNVISRLVEAREGCCGHDWTTLFEKSFKALLSGGGFYNTGSRPGRP